MAFLLGVKEGNPRPACTKVPKTGIARVYAGCMPVLLHGLQALPVLGFNDFSGGLAGRRWAVVVHRVDAGALRWRIFGFGVFAAGGIVLRP